jgi:hypothetical protein
MKKNHFSVPLDNGIVEKFNDEEVVLVCGGKGSVSIIKVLLNILGGGGGNGVCGNLAVPTLVTV